MASAHSTETPIIIGVGEIKNASTDPAKAIEPMQLMLQAIQEAIENSKIPKSSESVLLSGIDSIDVVRPWSWPYADLPGLLASKLNVAPKHTSCSEHRGSAPATMVDEAARRVANGGCKVALVTGGEAMASISACANANKIPPVGWTEPPKDANTLWSPTAIALPNNVGGIHSIGAPIHVYPLYENAFRAQRKQTLLDNNHESAELYASFAKVAEKHPMAWSYGKPAETTESIGTINRRNRMICLPYPLLMNAFNNVNLAAACIITSVSLAKSIGVPEEQWVYLLGGAGTQESSNFWQRSCYHSSPAISQSLDAALDTSGISKDEVDLFDFYSCFPIIPKLACHHLGLSILNPDRPITLLGGFTSFGGAGNNYSMHAIAEMVRQLRKGKTSATGTPRTGLLLANGGVATYQHIICLSIAPRPTGTPYPQRNPLPEILEGEAVPEMEYNPQGKATIETYTVEFNRNGTPLRGHVVGLLNSNGRRFLANHADVATLTQLASLDIEQSGRIGWVRPDIQRNGRNLFSFIESEVARL